MITSFFRSLILSMFAAMLMAGEPPSTASWEAFKATHVDALVGFVTAGSGGDQSGSLELEVRQEAAAFAKKIDSKSAKLKNLFARKRVMTAEEAAELLRNGIDPEHAKAPHPELFRRFLRAMT